MYRSYSVDLKRLILSFVSAIVPGYISSIIVGKNFLDYKFLKISPIFPNELVFPFIFMGFYILMGISFYIILGKKLAGRGSAVYSYYLQIFIAFIWPYLFFALEAYSFALIWLVILWISTFAMIFLFWRCSKLAALLQLPYFLWIGFSTYLNYLICTL